MNTIHEVPLNDEQNGGSDITLTNASSNSSTNINDINGSSSTDTQTTATTSNDLATSSSSTSTTISNNQTNGATSSSIKTTSLLSSSKSSALHDGGDIVGDLKIIGHIKNIEKINEKRRLFLNNTISEYTIDEQSESETKTSTGVGGIHGDINGVNGKIENTDTLHMKFNEKRVVILEKEIQSNSNSDDQLRSQSPKTVAPVKSPLTPPPKPPMLSRARSLGMGDRRSTSVNSPHPTHQHPPTPTPTPSLSQPAFPAFANAVNNTVPPTPISHHRPIKTPAPAIPAPQVPTVATTAAAEAAAATPTVVDNSITKTTITTMQMPQPEAVQITTVQLKKCPDEDEEAPVALRRIERPVSLTPEAPKQISERHYERLVEELKCPGCAHPMKAPILLCKTGHSICEQCTRVLMLCPLCKEPFTNLRSLTVEALCSKAHFRCTNAPGGCTVRLQIDLLAWHEKQCIYKPMKCFMGRVWGDCQWAGREAYWKDHLEADHANKVFKTDSMDLIWNMGVKQKPLTGYYVFETFDEMFNFYEVYDKDRVLFTMACTSTIKEKKHNYAFEVTMICEENEALAITQKFPVHSEYDNDILAEGTCVSISLSDLVKFIDEDRLLHYRVRIVEVKTPRKLKHSRYNSPTTSMHPIDFQQTQIEGSNLKNVPNEVIVTRKRENGNDTTSVGAQSSIGGIQSAVESENENEQSIDKEKRKDTRNDSCSESDPEFDAYIAKRWGTPQMNFNRKFLKNSSNDNSSNDDTTSMRVNQKDKHHAEDDKISIASTSYKKRVSNSFRKSFRGFNTTNLFSKKNHDKNTEK